MSTWRKSTFSNGNGGNNCVETMQAEVTREVFVRHSRTAVHAGEPFIMFTLAEWRAFVAGVKAGEFDYE